MATKLMPQTSLKQRRKRVAGIAATIVGLLGLVGTLLIPTASAVETVNQSATFARVDPGVPQEVQINQCDPANGVLTEVVLSVTADTSISYRAENESDGVFAGDESITADVGIRLFLGGPGLTAPGLMVEDTLTDARTLGAPTDGVTDFGGTSGYTSPPQLASGSDTVTLTGADLAPFIGTGMLAYQLNAAGPSNFGTMNYAETAFESSPFVEGGVIDITCTFLTPSIAIEKSTNGDDADDTLGPELALGDTVTWRYVVTNDGDLDLTDVAVTDSEEGPVTCPQTTLAVGESMECTLQGVAAVGNYENNARVDAMGPNGEDVFDEDPSHYNVPPNPSIMIEKDTNGDDADDTAGPELALGDDVLWTYVVTNNGNIDLIDVAVVDDIEGGVTCPETTLAVGEMMTCTADGTAATVGQYTNNATVTGVGTDPDATPVTDDDPSNYNVPANPAIMIEKDTNGDDADDTAGPTLAVGDDVIWTYVVTNIGNVDLIEVAVTDDVEGAVTCPETSLAVGVMMSCTLQGVAALGDYENNATVTGVGTDPDATPVTDADPSHYNVPANPAINIEKDTNGDDADDTAGPTLAVGDEVIWTYVVSNVGNVDLIDVAVTDDIEGGVTCPETALAVGEMMTCTAEGVAVVGDYENNATVTGVGTDPDATPVTDADPSHYNVPSSPAIDIEKDTNGDQADDTAGPTLTEGDAVTWTYVVTNTGNVDLTDVAVTDDVEGAVTCPETALAVGEMMTCSLEGVAEIGDYENNATVTGVGTDPDATPVTDADPSHYTGVPEGMPAIDIEKSTNGVDADAEGSGPVLIEGALVTWTYLVTNSGDVDLVNIAVVDDPEGPVTCPETALAVGESMTCSRSGVATVGAYENNASVTGETPDGVPVADMDPSRYSGEPMPPAPTPIPPPAPTATPVPVIVVIPPTPVPVIIHPAPAPPVVVKKVTPEPKKVEPVKKAEEPAKKTELALTGTQSTAMSLLAAAIMGAGMITLGMSYRREEEAI